MKGTKSTADVEITMIGMDEDEDDAEDLFVRSRYLDVAAVKAVCDVFKKNKKGYLGILNFAVFVALYFSVIYGQRDNTTIGLENRALRMPIQQLKPNTKVTTVPEFWAYLNAQILPWLIAEETWEMEVAPNDINKFNHTELLRGGNAQQYSQIIGGIALIQTRGGPSACPSNTVFWPPDGTTSVSCYTEQRSTQKFAVTGPVTDSAGSTSAVTMEIPNDPTSGAYCSLLPSTATPDQLKGLVSYLENAQFVDAATRSIEVRVPVFNGNTNTIGIFSWSLEIDLAGHISHGLTAAAVPYYLYDRGNWHFEVFRQLLLLYWVSFMIRGLWNGYLSTWTLPAWLEKRYPNAKKNAATSVMPANPAGQTYISIPATMFTTILICVVSWVVIMMKYLELHKTTEYDPHKTLKLFGAKPDSLVHVIENNQKDVLQVLSLIHISEPTRLLSISYAVFCLKKKKK
eukprot:TRINITY_DN16481_c0_g1_i2.p1 TRINITY_DN16481_c0_g1~~TRINITY_DN16481_c0_g1_i2.p1  ORF type:complete len:457 (-),score=91.36 TRINITY_DN16481_c0_g1_i2:120-1490(-)